MKPRLFFAVPCYRNVDMFWATCVMQMHGALLRAGIPMHLGVKVGESLVPRARNELARDFLATDCTHLLFIDTDQAFAPDLALKLLESGHELVGCAVPKKRINWERVVAMARAGCPVEDVARLSSDVVLNYDQTTGEAVPVDEHDCIPVHAIGTGVMLVARGVFDRVRERFGEEIWYRSDRPENMGATMHAYFDTHIETDSSRRYLSEDYEFCRRARAVGAQPHVYWRGVIGHIGHYEYQGNLLSMFQPTKE